MATVDKEGELKEYLGIELNGQTFSDLIAAQEPARLALGQSRVIWLYILPAASYGDHVRARYGELEPDRLTVRDLRSQAKMGRIVSEQVTAKGKPNAYGAVYKRDSLNAYAVPGDLYWQAWVEGEEQ